jgi:hypothetical protein
VPSVVRGEKYRSLDVRHEIFRLVADDPRLAHHGVVVQSNSSCDHVGVGHRKKVALELTWGAILLL